MKRPHMHPIARRAGDPASRLAPLWRRVSLRTKIYLGYLALITVPLVVVALAAYHTSTVTIEGNAQGFSARLTAQTRDNLDAYAQQLDRLTYWPFLARDIQTVLRSYGSGPRRPPAFRDVVTMDDELAILGRGRTDVAAVYVATVNGTLFDWTAAGEVRPHLAPTVARWYRAALAADPRTVFLPTQGQSMISVASGQVFSLVRTLHAPGTGRLIGAVRVDVDAAALASVVQQISLGTQGRLLVVTPTGDTVYPLDPTPDVRRQAREIADQRGGNRSGPLQFDLAGQRLLATYDTSSNTGWIVAGVVPTAQLLSGVDPLRAFILTVAALSILAGTLCATLIVGRLTRPLRRLRDAMRGVEARGDLDTRLEVRSEDEVGQLTQSFNTMLDELRRLVDDVLRAQIHEREAELHALQNQINPHFLYNTLESINMLALTHGDRDISRMVTSLGRLLRMTISTTGALIPLRDELTYVNHYLTVQRMRYGDRIVMDVEVDDALLDYLLPKLTLQPLVENALYHGLEPRRGQGRITVRGQPAGPDLLLTVEDDGVGISAEALAALHTTLEHAPPRASGHRSIGLANVQQRLKLYCGPAYGLAVESAPDRGTRVTVCIPRTLPGQQPAEQGDRGQGDDADAPDRPLLSIQS